MAKLVLAAGVPHPPRLVREIADSPVELRAASLMKQVRRYVEKAAPDVIIEVDSDHFVNFFYNNVPAFCVGLAEEAEGPQEIWCPMPRYVVKGHVPLARGLLSYGLRSNFDLAAAEELRLDHSVVVPLHFLNPNMEIPVVPLYTNGFAAPTPTARRCYSVGRMVRRFIDQWGENLRVAIIASGCFAQDVGGPLRGWTDEEWSTTVANLLETGRYQTLARRATAQRMAAAGNNSTELLNWITLTGAVGFTRPLFLETDDGNGYAVWDLE
jgi:hypothetical protein